MMTRSMNAQTKTQTKTQPKETFQDCIYEPYLSVKSPIKSYCLDMIAYCKNTGEGTYFGGLLGLLDQTEIFKQYRNWEAEYDECYFKIPLDEWTKKTGLTIKQTQKVNDCFDPYMGSLNIYGETVCITGDS